MTPQEEKEFVEQAFGKLMAETGTLHHYRAGNSRFRAGAQGNSAVSLQGISDLIPASPE